MESFLKRVLLKKSDPEAKKYFVRFGKGRYNRRFLISFDKTAEKIKIRASFELANDIVKFLDELIKNAQFSGKILMKNKVPGKEGKKKAGVFVYEINEETIKEYENAYYYLLDLNNNEAVLKIKKSLPKPGKDERKIDDKFCSLDIDIKYWREVKDYFFWDAPECKKAVIEHDIIIIDIEMPKDEKDPVKIREQAKRIGKTVRRIEIDKKETLKEYDLEI